VIVASSQGKELETRVTHVRSINGGYILGLEAFSTPEEAAGFRGTFLKIPRDQTAAAQPGHYYEFQLLGLTVVSESGDRLGRIEDILETRGHHVFVIRNARGERLLPATKAVVRSVDLDAGTMTVQWTDLEEDAADAV
jgi:16S rRNA processing protein RimM